VSELGRARRVRDALSPKEWRRVGGMTLTVVALNVLGWGMLVLAVRGHVHVSKAATFGLGTGVLAYTLGMRHAFDADHIAAIDNTTRKLVHDGERPLGVGYFFSLGHSSVVFVLAVLLNFGFRWLNGSISSKGSSLHVWTGVVGTSVSGAFLWLIGILNLIVLMSIVKVARELREGRFDDAELERRLAERGLMNRLLGSYAKRVDAPWKMYPVGVLFGLGFDTVTEVALLVLAGSAVVEGLPFYAVVSLPILFAAGMCLFDTLDGCFMNFAYDWAFAKPVRKIYYNLTITGLSVVIALFIGTVEILGLLAQEVRLTGPFWTTVEGFNLNRAGFVIVGLFVATWAVALCVWHFGQVERRWELEAATARATRQPATEPAV
jgi:high-affinity nickel-transport protein